MHVCVCYRSLFFVPSRNIVLSRWLKQRETELQDLRTAVLNTHHCAEKHAAL